MYDAVLVLPGIMGSELTDRVTGDVVWGMNLGTLVRGRLRQSLADLKVSDDDLAGRGRLRATRLLRRVGFLPGLGGLEPYTALLAELRDHVPDSRSVGEFPYDWRLSIASSAQALVSKAAEHLDSWKKVVAAEQLPTDLNDVRLVIVAHSMGGLVARYAIERLGLHTVVRRLVTLGTPFYGSTKAIRVLATGEGAPPLASARAARELAITCPGVYDLLPRTECVTLAGATPRRLQATDLGSIGASTQLADESAARWEKLRMNDPRYRIPMSVMAGSDQSTAMTVALKGSDLIPTEMGYSTDGDGTVAESSALPAGIEAFYLPQQHEALAKSAEGRLFARKKMLGQGIGRQLGAGDAVGVDVPESLPVGAVSVRVTGVESAGDVSFTSEDLSDGTTRLWSAQKRDGSLHFTSALGCGYHRISVSQGGTPVTKIIHIVDPKEPNE